MSFLTTGTITATNGSTTVTGSGTNFLVAGVRAGDLIFITESSGPVPYGVAVDAPSDTDLTLQTNYEGTTGGGKTFFIMRRFDEEKAADTYRLINQAVTDLEDDTFVSVVTGTETAANIADISNAINTTNKVAGRHVFDTTNNRLMVASGSAAASPWYVADGSASVTPS